MNIGVDIDGVLINYYNFQKKYGKKYIKATGVGKVIDFKKEDTKDIFGWSGQQDDDFWDLHIENYSKNQKAIRGAGKYIKKLGNDGHDIYLITARSWAAHDDEKGKLMRGWIEQWLKNNNIIYKNIYYSPTNDKRHIVSNLDLDYMIEDSENNAAQLKAITKILLYDWPYNRNCAGKNIFRVKSWRQIYKHLKKANIKT